MLTHVQASHTDALKTHSLQTFLPQDWKTKRGQRPRKKIDIRVVPALREDSPDRKVPFQYCSNFTEAVSFHERLRYNKGAEVSACIRRMPDTCVFVLIP